MTTRTPAGLDRGDNRFRRGLAFDHAVGDAQLPGGVHVRGADQGLVVVGGKSGGAAVGVQVARIEVAELHRVKGIRMLFQQSAQGEGRRVEGVGRYHQITILPHRPQVVKGSGGA